MIKNKLLPILALIFYVLLFPITSVAQEMKPDLIISSVFTRTEWKDVPDSGLKTGISNKRNKVLIYDIRVTNIGRATFTGQFYIGFTNDVFSSKKDCYGGPYPVNKNAEEISVGAYIDVQIQITLMDASRTGARFLIQTDGKPHCNDPKPKIEELNYDNNTYMY
jgi:hypothetical protein